MKNQEKKPKNPNAFPYVFTNLNGYTEMDTGMTLRDYFASKVIQGIFSNNQREPKFGKPTYYVEEAYKIADAMLKERENE